MEIRHEVAIILLTDRNGRILLQFRTFDAPTEPGRWSPPAGRLEQGEDALVAAHRELAEETGLTAELALDDVVDEVRPNGAVDRFYVFVGTTEARQEDVVLGEGLAMRFLTREEIRARDLSTIARRLFGAPPADTGSR